MRTSYGDVLAEQRAMLEDVALVEGGHDLVWVEGPDAVSFLDGILSQDLTGMEPGGVARSFLLQPQGKLRHLLWLMRGADRVGLLVDAGRGEMLAADLGYYRIRVKAEIRRDDRPVAVLWGPRAFEVAAAGPYWSEDGGRVLIPLSIPGVDRVVVVGEPVAGSIPMAGRLAVTAVRVAAGEPVMDVDVDESTIPQESGLVPASVSFTKGCYLGQELVARIDSRGHVNRRLCGLVVTRNVLPPEGSAVWVGDREVGTITSVCESFAVGAPIGLGLIRREVETNEGIEIRWEGGAAPAIVRALPLLPFSS